MPSRATRAHAPTCGGRSATRSRRSTRSDGSAVRPGRLDVLAAAISEDDDDPTVAYAATVDEAISAVLDAIGAGSSAIAVVPVGLAVDDAGASLRDPDLLQLHRRLDEVGREHPDVELQYVGPPFDHAPALEAAVAALRPAGLGGAGAARGRRSTAPSAATSTGSRGSWPRSRRGSPRARDSSSAARRVQGKSYKTGEPFDAKGPGTSDLDIVLIGERCDGRMGARRVLSSRGEHPAAVRRGARHRGRAARASSRGGASASQDGPWRSRRWRAGSWTSGPGCRGRPTSSSGADRHPVRLVSYNIRFGGEGRLALHRCRPRAPAIPTSSCSRRRPIRSRSIASRSVPACRTSTSSPGGRWPR